MFVSELKEASERTQAQCRLEKQRRKELELKVNNLEEDLQDLKTDKEALERVRTFVFPSVRQSFLEMLFDSVPSPPSLDSLGKEEEVACGASTLA